MEATIKFKGGEVIVAEENGGSYITDVKPEFPEDLDDLQIETEQGVKTFAHAQLVECAHTDRAYWFSFIEADPRDIQIAELKAENDMLTECILEMSEVVYGE